jgi:hypothetical protein
LYYFDGTEGLHKALSTRWQAMSVHSASRTLDQRPWARLLAWQGLTADGGHPSADDAYFGAMVDEVRHRRKR